MNIYCKNRSVWHPRAGRFLIALLASAILTACHTPVRHNANEPVRLSGEAQGTYYSILYYDSLQRNLQPQIDSLLDDFDLTASLWVDSSLLRRLNANLTDTLNPLLADLLQQSLYINRYTDGAFDCRIGRLVQAWGFSFRQREELDGSTLDGGFGLAAVLGAVVGAAFALGGGALLTAHAGVGAGLLGLLDGAGVLGSLGGLVVVAGNHSEHSDGGHSGKQNFLHCFDVFG